MLPIPLSPLLLAPLTTKANCQGLTTETTCLLGFSASFLVCLPIPLGSHISRPQDSRNHGEHLTTTVAPWPRKMPPVLVETSQLVQQHSVAGESGSQSMKSHSCLLGRASSLETETQCQCEKQKNAPPPPKVPILTPRTCEDVTLRGKGDFM